MKDFAIINFVIAANIHWTVNYLVTTRKNHIIFLYNLRRSALGNRYSLTITEKSEQTATNPSQSSVLPVVVAVELPFLRVKLPVSAIRWREFDLDGCCSSLLFWFWKFAEVALEGGERGKIDVPLRGLPGCDCAVLPRRLRLRLISRRFPTSATRAQGRELREPRASVGEWKTDGTGLPKEEDKEGGGTEG
jgi:hypothetical protein